MPQQEFVTIKRASERLGVSPRTIRRWILDIGTPNITRGTAKRRTLEVNITALEQHKGHEQEAQGTQEAKSAKGTRGARDIGDTRGAQKIQKERVKSGKKHQRALRAQEAQGTRDTQDISGTRDIDIQDIIPRAVLESKNEIIQKQDKHIALLESQLQEEREQRKRSDILLAETLQKIPRLEAPQPQKKEKRRKFLGIF